MSIPFSRSLRSLKDDSFLPSVAGLAITSLFLIAWAGWFFFAKIAVSEISQQFQVNRDGSLQVTFPSHSLEHIQPGQTVALRIIVNRRIQTIQGEVMDVKPKENSGQVRVYLYSDEIVKQNTQGQVQVEVEQVSPATLLLRAAESIGQPSQLPAIQPTSNS
jgi:hypothetical protein